MVQEKSQVQEAIDAFTKYCDKNDFIRYALMYNILTTIAGPAYKFPIIDDESEDESKPLDR